MTATATLSTSSAPTGSPPTSLPAFLVQPAVTPTVAKSIAAVVGAPTATFVVTPHDQVTRIVSIPTSGAHPGNTTMLITPAPVPQTTLRHVSSSDGSEGDSAHAGRHENRAPKTEPQPTPARIHTSGMRLNKFVRRLHDMLQAEQNSGIVEWRRGLLVLHSTDTFAKTILPKYFNTRNFKTFRRQLNYYGFVHVRSFSTTGSTTTALWVNRDLAQKGTAHISSVLMLKRVEPCESAKTAEGRRVRKELAVSTVEDDIGVSAKSLQLEQIRSLAAIGNNSTSSSPQQVAAAPPPDLPSFVLCKPNKDMDAMLPSFPPLPDHERGVSSNVVPPCSASDITPVEDDAANLLMMLSKATVVRP